MRDESYGEVTTPRFSFSAPRECVLDGLRDWCAAKLGPEIGSKIPATIARTWTLVVVISQLSLIESYYPSGWSKSAADKPSDYLSTNQRHMGFDKGPRLALRDCEQARANDERQIE